jgi:thioredoxin-related protein
MKQILTGLFALFCMAGIAQQTSKETGMQFEHGTWAEIKAKAKKENKNIFMDAYTTWCGPCKMMAKNIFPLPEAGEFFNANYINVKVQLDTTKNDDEYIKGWYKDAHDIMVGYNVRVFPTYLFISPEGKLLHRAVGASDVATFIGKGKDALDPNKQYYTLQDRYNAGEKSEALLRSLTLAATNAYDKPNASKYGSEFFASQKELNTEENIKLIDAITESSKDPGFKFIVENPTAYNKVIGEGASEKKIRMIAVREDVFPVIRKKGVTPDWDALQKNLTAKYPAMADEIMSYGKITYYGNVTQDYPAFSKEVSSYMEKYAGRFSPQELNAYAWTIFSRCEDVNCIDQALQWSKKSVDLTSNHMFMDTYANLLYKKGQKDEAIVWEEKALVAAKADNSDTASYEETIKKMKSGEKTWD